MKYRMQADNIYVIDTKMFGFEHYSSCFLVKGKELALIDTGMPNQYEDLRKGIQAHGFSITDISYIFVSHCEHPDHAGNVGNIMQDNPEARVYINPVGTEYLTNPSIEDAKRRAELPAKMADRFGTMTPVPQPRIHHLRDGEVIDLGDGEKLKIFFSAGHQPSGLVILEEKFNGFFINDFVGNYFPDADYLTVLNPSRSNVIKAREMLNKAQDMAVTRLFLGHFGICDAPGQLIQRALNNIELLLDAGEQCLKEGVPQEIEPRVLAIKVKEAEKLRKVRGEKVYEHETTELATSQARYFAKFFKEMKQNKVI
jgi:glyoxylase-like metal-dependent hydrolase (beta-lactamase superfamily II)